MWIKPKPWTGKDLQGTYEVTLKVDGVQARLSPERVVSRAGKPLYNMDHLRPSSGERIVEVFCGSWEKSAGACRRHNGTPLEERELYKLYPHLDARLSGTKLGFPHEAVNPTASEIDAWMKRALMHGYEGLVLRGAEEWLKVKPTATYDVAVLDIQAGAGKHAGRMGALMTTKGKVGTGFTDADRIVWWNRRKRLGGERYIIEVDCMGLTPAGKFRHPRYMRLRFDKNEEG